MLPNNKCLLSSETHWLNEKTWCLKQQLGDLCNVLRYTCHNLCISKSPKTALNTDEQSLLRAPVIYFLGRNDTDCRVCLVLSTTKTTEHVRRLSFPLVSHIHTKHRECLCDLRIVSLSWNKDSPSMNVFSNPVRVLMYGQKKKSYICMLYNFSAFNMMRITLTDNERPYCFTQTTSAAF